MRSTWLDQSEESVTLDHNDLGVVSSSPRLSVEIGKMGIIVEDKY